MTYYILAPIAVVVAILIAIVRYARKSLKRTYELNEKFEVLEIQVPKLEDEANKDITTSALAAENVFASLHGLLREEYDMQEYFSFDIVSAGETGIKFYVAVPLSVVKFLESQLYAQYPTAQIKVVEDYMQKFVDDGTYEIAHLTFARETFFPIKTFRDFEIDPLSAITSALSEAVSGEQVWFQVIVKPIPDIWQKKGYNYVNSARTGVADRKETFFSSLFSVLVQELLGIITGIFTKWVVSDSTKAPKNYRETSTIPTRLSASQDLELKAIENKLSKMGFETVVKIFSYAKNSQRVENNLRSLMASLKQFSSSTLNSLNYSLEGNKRAGLELMKKRSFESGRAIILNVEELASIYHLPSSNVETPNISWVYSRKSEPPTTLPTTNCTYIGETLFRSHKVRFGIADGDDRLRHMYLIGKTGTGKSTLFETMATQDIRKGFGVGVIDPHGETIDKILERIPDDRVDDVVYIDPSDTERPIGINLLELSDPSQKNLMASALVAAIKHHFDYSWGPRLEYLLNYAILTLLEVEGTTMLAITRLLEDDNYRKYILHQVKDPVTIRFWEKEYKEMKGNQKLVTEAIAPIQNKVNRFLASSTIRNILGQRKSTVNIWDIMNSGKILLMNLSKGKIGSDNSNLLGALLVSRIQFMALQRANIPYDQRNPFYLYVDEFQNFATGSFEEILSESRKYKLGLYLTHQFTGQLSEELLKSVFGNVGTIMAFSLGAPDAMALANEFAPYFEQNDIISLERFHVYIKLMIDGMTSLPFSARILLPWEENDLVPKTNNKEKILEMSRQKYGVDRNYVEEKVKKWIETPFDKGMAIAQEMRAKQESGQDAGSAAVVAGPIVPVVPNPS